MTAPSDPVNLLLSNELKLTGLSDSLREEWVKKLTLPNPKWLENERMGRWNRDTPPTLKFYRKSGKNGIVVPRGTIRQVLSLFKQKGIRHTLEDNRRELAPVDMPFTGTLKAFQQIAAGEMLRKEFGTLCAPTGSGKTVMALHMISQRRQPAVVVVHTKDLACQWVKRITDFLAIAENEIGFIGAGKKRIGERITVAMVQSLYKCVEEVVPCCGYLIVDECHRAPSRTFTDAISAFDSRYMLGLSATPWRRDKLSSLIFWYLGDLHHEIQQAGLVEKGHILEAQIIVRETGFKAFHDPVTEYSRMLSELTADDGRNRLIAADVADVAKQGEGVCLVLTDRKLHAETLNALLHYKYRLPSALLTGDLTMSQRREVVARLNRGEIAVLVATGQLIGEGFDCSNLSTLFLATPIRFSGRVLQYLGRVLRSAPGKTRARVYDYVDVNVDVLCAAARARQSVYNNTRESDV
ncbi:MAG: DEAD/DEAH box helicase [Pseudomonadota bacterium]